MLRISLKTVWAHKRRLLGTFVAVALGVAFLSGTLLLGDTMTSNFEQLFRDANGSTDVVVRSATQVSTNVGQSNRARIDAGLVPVVQRVDGVAAAVPYIEGYGQLLGRDGTPIGGGGPPTRAASWVTVPRLNPYHVVEGRAPQADDEVVINRGAAKTGDLHVGDTTTLLTPAPVQVRIVGLTAFGTADGFGPSTYTGLTLDSASRHLTNDSNDLTEIRVEATPGVAPAVLASRIAAAVPNGVEAITGAQLAKENFENVESGFLGVVRNGLVAFALVALLVAAFSIFNTFSILVVQSGRDAALARAVGATRGQVVVVRAVEALAVGVAGSLAGWVAGIALAALLKGVFDAFGFALPAGGLVIDPASTAIALVVGVLTASVAGIVPAIRASRIPPVVALRDAAAEPPLVARRRAWAGTVVAALGVLAVVAAVSNASAAVVAVGAVGCLAGVLLLAPVLARPALAVLGRPVAAVRGVTGRLARENARRHPRRTAATAAALVVGVCVVALFTVFGASLRASAAKGVDESLRADVVVDTAGYGGQTGATGFGPQLFDDVRRVSGVDSVTALRSGSAVLDGHIAAVTAVNPATVGSVLDLDVVSGDLAALDARGIAVSEDVAGEHHWSPGTVVPITYPDGNHDEVTVAAVYRHTTLVGDYVMSQSVWSPHSSQTIDRALLVHLAPGSDADAARAAIARAASSYGDARVQTRAGYRASVTQGVSTILGLIYVMLALAIVIALMGIANTLSLAVHERSRELGLLRAVGQTRRQTRSMVRWESVMIAVFGTVIGVALGTFLGWGVVEASGSATLTEFSLPTTQLVVFLVVGAVAGTVASIRPARRAARLDVLTALAAE